ncbi:MAG TPA: NAD(P)/FAD-dependent oxidoreductase [Candidatus Saccharimonadales bacterium]|nr:NAD(P)/FAD-dependent oxidoreductase [Candidatus Saccharimonadales bacterium]
MAKERVLIVGGGFAGVKTALELCKDHRFDVTLLSDDTDLRYYPTLYHTATGGKRANSSIPLETLFEGKPITLAQGTATKLIRKDKTVTTNKGRAFEYDTLILALGVVTNYFGIPGLAEYSYSIKTQAEAARFKKHLHEQLEDEHRPDLHYVIVGAGPTGIELAGALPSYLKHVMKKHGIKHRAIHIDLIEAAPRLLPRLPKDTSRAVRKRLKKLGVRLYLKSMVQGETADGLTVSGKPIRSHTVVWTAGVTNHPFFKDNGFVLTGRGKVATDIYLQAEPDIYVLGDNANTPYSGMAQTALWDGKFIARNLKRKASGWRLRSYQAKPPITVLPCGPRWAAVVWGHVRLYGWIGWFLREAADMKGFRDLESWKRATKQWYTEFTRDDGCDVCAAQEN